MSDSDKNELVTQFSGVTGVDTDRATFFLESAAWNLDLALGSFYDQGDDVDLEPEQAQPPGGSSGESGAGGPVSQSKPEPRIQPKPQSRFATIAKMREDEDSDSDSDREAYYAGGSDHGAGQQILDPRKKKKNADTLVQDMFKAAKEHGAEEIGDEAPTGRPSKPITFRGTGYRLGETEEPSLAVPGFPVQSQPRQIDRVLKLWKEGFSVDDGPLRGYNVPENQDFLTSIKKGEVPKELTKDAKGGEVNLNMEDHRDEEYVKPKVAIKAFSGSGNRLGSPAATVIQNEPAASSAGQGRSSASGTSQQQSSCAGAAASNVADQSKPVTSLQIRLSDGSRMLAKFNHTHTIADVRQYINSSRPQFAGANYILMTTFPNKELTDEAETLQSANLLNAVLVQKLK